MKKLSRVLIFSALIFSMNGYADDSDIQPPVMVIPQKPVDVVSGIKAGALVLRDGAEYGYYEMDLAGNWVFHKLDIAIEGVGHDAHVVRVALGPVLASDGQHIGQAVKATGAAIAQPYQNLSDPNKQDVAHAVGDTGVLVGEAGKQTGKGVAVAAVAVGKTVGDAAVESYGDGHKPVDVVSGVADTGRFFGKLGKKIFEPFKHAAKAVDGHYVVPVKLENQKEKIAIAQAIAAQQAVNNPAGIGNVPAFNPMVAADIQQKPLTDDQIATELSSMSVQRSPAVLPETTSGSAD